MIVRKGVICEGVSDDICVGERVCTHHSVETGVGGVRMCFVGVGR